MSEDVAKPPAVERGSWIRIGPMRIRGYVFDVRPDGALSVGYYQNGIKPIGEEVVWDGSQWTFKYEGPCGSYLTGWEAEIVKCGPRG